MNEDQSVVLLTMAELGHRLKSGTSTNMRVLTSEPQRERDRMKRNTETQLIKTLYGTTGPWWWWWWSVY